MYSLLGLAGILLFSNVCLASPSPTVASFTALTQGFFHQSLEVIGPFPSANVDSNNPWVDWTGEETEKISKKQKPSPVTWNLEMGYSHLSSLATAVDPSVSEDVFTAQAGLRWAVSPQFVSNLAIDFDSIPLEAYRHGAAVLHFEYLWPLGRKFRRNEDNDPFEASSEDASGYYRKERERKLRQLESKWMLEQVDLGEEEVVERQIAKSYPQLRLAYNLGFNVHTIEAKAARVPSKVTVPSQSLILKQYQYGPEIAYSPKAEATYKLAVSYLMYSNTPDAFINLVDLGDSARVPVFPENGISAASNQLLSFPVWYIGLGAHWVFKRGDRFDLNAAHLAYASASQTATFSLYPVYRHLFFKKWDVGIGAAGTLRSDTTQILGTLSLSYRM